MRTFLFAMAALLVSLGCARVKVEAPKEPIKVDISMRLDIYQHVQKDIDAIEGIVSGAKKEPVAQGGQSFLGLALPSAYAQELSPEVEQAALRRRDRAAQLSSLEQKGVVGEDKAGLVRLRGADASAEALVAAENSDRMLIYRALAAKNNTSVEEIQKIYAERLQKDAPAGTPVEVFNSSTGTYEWKVK